MKMRTLEGRVARGHGDISKEALGPSRELIRNEIVTQFVATRRPNYRIILKKAG